MLLLGTPLPLSTLKPPRDAFRFCVWLHIFRVASLLLQTPSRRISSLRPTRVGGLPLFSATLT